MAAVQGAVLSVLVVTVPAVAAFVATSADPVNAELGWTRAAVVGLVLWLLGHGGAASVAGTTVTLVPLGLTLLVLFTTYASARRSMAPARSAWVAGIVTYTTLVVTAIVLTGPSGPWGAGPAMTSRAVVGGALVGAVGLGAGAPARGSLRELTRRWWEPVPRWVRAACGAGGVLAVTLLGVGGALTVVWVLAGRAPAGDVLTALDLDALGGGVLAVGQLLLLPNLVLWAVAWVAGPGFAVGAGTVYSPSEVLTGPLPALPLLGALPAQVPDVAMWAPVLVVVAGALAGRWLSLALVRERPWHTAAACGT
ncbi:cell division protein PerM, partial [Cellulomonas bogoriensis]|uniref:cell division protein PerM n=1 Tax=Cellulomonas bogoriensis TaxID=301388 RepID=UPI0012EBE5B6